MKKLSIISLALLALLSACAPSMYGVPQETWDRMSEMERVVAIQAYEREQQARRQAVEERVRHEAVERERERAHQAAVERERRERIEAIHRGEGAYGELIRVRLQGGKIKVGDRHHRYEPITFTIADGETRKIGVADRAGREVDLIVTYVGGAFSLEGVHFPYGRHWGQGKLYADTGTSGPLELRGVDVFIEVRDRSARYDRERPRLLIIREDERPVVIREKEVPKHSSAILREKGVPPPAVVNRDREAPKHQPSVRVKDTPPPGPKAPPAAAEHLPRTVEIVLLSGELEVRGQKQQLERTTVRIAEGESRELAVKTEHEYRTLMLHFRNGELVIDVNPGKKREAVRFPIDSEWNKGKTYKFSLKGRVPLEKVEMKVTGLAK